MTDPQPLKSTPARRLKRNFLSTASKGGPTRLVAIVGVVVAMVGLVIVLSLRYEKGDTGSQVAKMGRMNLLPGGLQSTPAQEALRKKHAGEEAEKAQKAAQSYTPVMPGSERLPPHEVGFDTPAVQSPPVNQVHIVLADPPKYTPPETPAPRIVSDDEFEEPVKVQRVAMAAQETQTDASLTPDQRKAYQNMMAQWDIQPPRTIVVYPERALSEERGESAPRGRVEREAGAIPRAPNKGRVLVPAGRGVYAHTVLSVSSDSGGPIVLEADTGPLMGDRMIGTFSKSGNDRLVVRISRVEHHGEGLEVSGLVVAPDSMETSVASDIDQHYIERFALPAAAAFVQGIGQAATQSNTSTTVSPYGGFTSTIGPVSIAQAGWMGFGAAAQAVGKELNQTTPKGPTIHLDANIGVGVMFLDNVVAVEK